MRNVVLALALVMSALAISPANPDMECEERVLTPSWKWEERFKPATLFDGFFKATGTIYAQVGGSGGTGYMLYPVFSINNGIWWQYNDPSGLKRGFFYLTIPGVNTFLASNMTISPIRETNYICQKFYPPTPTETSSLYSEMEVRGELSADTVYLLKDGPNKGESLKREFFHWANDTNSSDNVLTTYKLGPTGVQSVATVTFIHFNRITEDQARELGWTGSNPWVPSSHKRGLSIGNLGMVPYQFLNEEARNKLGY